MQPRGHANQRNTHYHKTNDASREQARSGLNRTSAHDNTDCQSTELDKLRNRFEKRTGSVPAFRAIATVEKPSLKAHEHVQGQD
jgi:hypothetical protein